MAPRPTERLDGTVSEPVQAALARLEIGWVAGDSHCGIAPVQSGLRFKSASPGCTVGAFVV